MKVSKNLKKATVTLMAAVMLSGSLTVPVMAHGHHGGGHHATQYTGVYCVYHNTTHQSKTSCKRYCQKHQTIHRNGKRHAVRHH